MKELEFYRKPVALTRRPAIQPEIDAPFSNGSLIHFLSGWFKTAFGYRVFGPGVINTRSVFPVHSLKVGCDIPDFSLRFF
ncbi:MAG: hypothetical protein WBN76_05710, partial [Azonexus sp.]